MVILYWFGLTLVGGVILAICLRLWDKYWDK